MRTLVKRAELAWQNLAFRRWQKRNPGASFKQYFAEGIKDRLDDGKTRASLGATLKGDGFGELGKRNFQLLLCNTYGLKPDDVCVDYGCGTLRMGVHVIKYLAPGHYTGLDIDQAMLDQGAKLIGPELIAAKRPELAVISPASVAAAAARRPTLLFSLKVLIHVYPTELEEYFANLLAIVGNSGKAVVTGKWSPGDTFQTAKKSWAHSLPAMQAIVAKQGGKLVVAQEEDYVFEDLGETGRAGTLEIATVAGA
jgi:SAM-dependent methyltransferase